MSFDITPVLEEAEQYCLYDREHFGERLEGLQPTDYEKLKGIILQWQTDLFDESSYSSPDGFGFLNAEHVIDVNNSEESSEAVVLFGNATAKLHHITHQNLLEHRAPSEEDLNTIHTIFVRAAEAFNEKSCGKVNSEFKQLALHPRLLEKCSEAFAKHVAEKSQSQVYSFDYSALVKDADPELQTVLKRWKNDLFMDLFCTQEGKAELGKEVKLPDYNALSYQDAWIETVKYMTRVAAMPDVASSEEATPSKEELIKKALEICLERYKAFRASQDLYIAKDEASFELEEINRSIKTLEERHQKLVTALKSLLAEAQGELTEAEECAEKYASLKEELVDETTTRQSSVKGLEKKIQDANASYETKLAEKQVELKKANETIEKAKEAKFPDAVGCRVPTSHIEDIQTLINHVTVLTSCYKAYIPYATGHASRELPKPAQPGLMGRFTSWFTWS